MTLQEIKDAVRQAGYKVGKAKKPGKVTVEQVEDMLRELGIE